MSEKRYVLHPGYVGSRQDRDRHYISGTELARLYGVPFWECVVDDGRGRALGLPADVVHLYPSQQGDYDALRKDER